MLLWPMAITFGNVTHIFDSDFSNTVQTIILFKTNRSLKQKYAMFPFAGFSVTISRIVFILNIELLMYNIITLTTHQNNYQVAETILFEMRHVLFCVSNVVKVSEICILRRIINVSNYYV